MAKEDVRHINVSGTPELLRLAKEVQSSRTSVVLVTDEGEAALVTPVHKQATSAVRTTPPSRDEILALRGSAGKLPRPLPWEDVRRIAQEDRAEEILASGK
jgi:hypothetical protein